jgi:signal transduction histidine kinase
VGINVRVVTLAATLGLAGANQALPGVIGGYVLLCVIAATACLPHPLQAVNRAVPVVEGALVGLTLGVTGLGNQPLGMYLVAPALLAGLVGGSSTVSATFLAELAALVTLPVVRLEPDLLASSVRSMLPWLLTAIGIGMLGSWIRRLSGAFVNEDHERYVAANQLLSQLRQVSRRLSSGLDPVALATTLLDDCLRCFPDGRGALLVRTEGGVFTSLAQRDGEGQTNPLVRYPMVAQCWNTAAAVYGVQADSDSIAHQSPQAATAANATRRGIRSALPLRVGTRMVGVLALELGQAITMNQRYELQSLLDERSLPLDTALLFDELRAVATVEERRRVAREIHDGVAQEIVSLGYLIDDLGSTTDDAARIVAVASVREELTRIVDDLRLSIFDLRSPVSRSTGLGLVLGDYLQVVGSQCDTAVHLTLDEGPDRLRLDVEEQLLRIVQEAITNARKHSGASNLWVNCHVRPPHAEIVIEDDGNGVGQNRRTDSFGLSVMQERAERIGAGLTIGERVGGGTRVSVALAAPGMSLKADTVQRSAKPLRHRAPSPANAHG